MEMIEMRKRPGTQVGEHVAEISLPAPPRASREPRRGLRRRLGRLLAELDAAIEEVAA